jgi:hypothetical protein
VRGRTRAPERRGLESKTKLLSSHRSLLRHGVEGVPCPSLSSGICGERPEWVTVVRHAGQGRGERRIRKFRRCRKTRLVLSTDHACCRRMDGVVG